jgi:hypothetical protein
LSLFQEFGEYLKCAAQSMALETDLTIRPLDPEHHRWVGVMLDLCEQRHTAVVSLRQVHRELGSRFKSKQAINQAVDELIR